VGRIAKFPDFHRQVYPFDKTPLYALLFDNSRVKLPNVTGFGHVGLSAPQTS
jgi:hypothetical protein